jgi:hypothetical protein
LQREKQTCAFGVEDFGGNIDRGESGAAAPIGTLSGNFGEGKAEQSRANISQLLTPFDVREGVS